MQQGQILDIVKIQSKGLMTIPKKFRESLGFEEDSFVRIKKEKGRLIIEPVRLLSYPARQYTDDETDTFLRLDRQESKELKKKRFI